MLKIRLHNMLHKYNIYRDDKQAARQIFVELPGRDHGRWDDGGSPLQESDRSPDYEVMKIR